MTLETVIQWMGGLLALSALGILFYGIWRGSQRQAGRTTGRAGAWLHSPFFYFTASALFFSVAWLGWIPLPVNFSSLTQIVMLAIGSLLYFPGLIFVLWGRLTLGKNYFVSTGFGAQLFKDQPLVTNGPYAIVRHPMYVGLALAAWGALLIYFTWTTVYFAVFAPFLMARARREEQTLAAEFGEQWQAYCKRIPAFFPRLRKVR
jgi:protein-S-isoprenylcysteine O-methyltransferase Ste14